MSSIQPIQPTKNPKAVTDKDKEMALEEAATDNMHQFLRTVVGTIEDDGNVETLRGVKAFSERQKLTLEKLSDQVQYLYDTLVAKGLLEK